MNRLVLVDGNAMMHRAYHALPPLTTPDGKPAQVVYGMVSMIMRLYQDLKPTHMAVAFDRPGPTFRNELFADYQIQRPKLDDNFAGQIPLVHDTIEAFGIPIYEADGFEADDVIGTICKQVAGKKIDQVVIVTGDRDILQLVVDDNVLVYMPTKGITEGKLYGEKEVVDRLGVKPELIPDWKALAGDPSDNYPGVAGIGPKTAADLVNAFGSVEKVYKGVSKRDARIKSSVQVKLHDGEADAKLFHTLATIRQDAPVTADLKHMARPLLNTPEAVKKLEELHFPSLVKRLTGNSDVPIQKVPHKENQKKDTSQQSLF